MRHIWTVKEIYLDCLKFQTREITSTCFKQYFLVAYLVYLAIYPTKTWSYLHKNSTWHDSRESGRHTQRDQSRSDNSKGLIEQVSNETTERQHNWTEEPDSEATLLRISDLWHFAQSLARIGNELTHASITQGIFTTISILIWTPGLLITSHIN